MLNNPQSMMVGIIWSHDQWSIHIPSVNNLFSLQGMCISTVHSLATLAHLVTWWTNYKIKLLDWDINIFRNDLYYFKCFSNQYVFNK